MEGFFQRVPVVASSRASTSASTRASDTSTSVATRPTSKDPIWKQFKDISVSNKHNFTVTCIHCAQIFKCIRPSKAILHIYGPPNQGIAVCNSNSPEILALRKAAAPPPPPVVRQAKDTNYFRNLSIAERKNAVDDAVARFFYANAIPFNASDCIEYKDMCLALASQPAAYHPPQRKALSTTLLQRCKAQVGKGLDNVMKIIHVTGATLCSDGWTNAAQDSLYNIMLTTPGGALFREMVVGTEERKTAAWLASRWAGVITDVGEQHIVSLCTDNAEVCRAAGKLIMQEFPHIIWVGCAAHAIDLLLKDACKHDFAAEILAEVKKVRQRCYAFLAACALTMWKSTVSIMQVVKFFKRRQVPYRLFRAEAEKASLRVTLKLHAATRFASGITMLDHFMKCRDVLNTVVNGEGFKDYTKTLPVTANAKDGACLATS